MSGATARDPSGSDLAHAPKAIRAGLLPEEAGDFDREYRRAMAEATETLDLTNVLGVLRRWQRVALSSRDPEAHRRMLRKAGLLLAGEPVATEPWDVTKVRLGLEASSPRRNRVNQAIRE